MTALSPTAQVVSDVATRADSYDLHRDLTDAIAKAIGHLLDGDRGRAHYVLMRATVRCARLSEADVDPVQAWAIYRAAMDRHCLLWSVRRQGRAT